LNKFSKECIVSSPNDTLKETVYDEYLKWCEIKKETPLKDNTFGKMMKQLGYLFKQKGTQFQNLVIKVM
jgi:hypothetical protein